MPAASSRSSTAPSSACSASSARCRAAAAGSRRSTRSSSAASSRFRAGATGDAAGWRSRRGRASARASAASACRRRASMERLGSLKSERAVSLIAIHAHGIPHVFPPRGAGAKRKPHSRPTLAGREDWRKLPLVTIDPADAKDHDDAVHAEPDPTRTIPAASSSRVAIADVAHYVRPGSALDREALDPRQLGLFPRPRRADAAGAHLQRPLLAAARARIARRSPCAWSIGADGRKRSHTLPPRPDALGREAALRAGAGRRRRPARRHNRAAAGARSRAALRRLSRGQARARRARAARSRPAGTQDRADGRTAPSTAWSRRSASTRTG